MPELASIKCDRCGTVSSLTTQIPALAKVTMSDDTGAVLGTYTFVVGPECLAVAGPTVMLMFPFSDISVAAAAANPAFAAVIAAAQAGGLASLAASQAAAAAAAAPPPTTTTAAPQ